MIEEFLATVGASGELAGRREEQAHRAVWDHATAEVIERMGETAGIEELVQHFAVRRRRWSRTLDTHEAWKVTSPRR